MARLIGGIFEGVASVGVDFCVRTFIQRLHGFFKRMHVVRRDTAIEATKISEEQGADLAEFSGICGQRAIIHHARRQVRLVNGEM